MIKETKGFTVSEIIIVVAVIGISAAIAVPSFIGQIPKHRLRGAARQVMSDLMWARMQAVAQKNEFKVFFISDHEYKILDDDNNDGNADSSEWVETKDIRQQCVDVKISSNANPIFFPRGSASMGTITVTNRSGSKKVKVHITGRVKIA